MLLGWLLQATGVLLRAYTFRMDSIQSACDDFCILGKMCLARCQFSWACLAQLCSRQLLWHKHNVWRQVDT